MNHLLLTALASSVCGIGFGGYIPTTLQISPDIATHKEGEPNSRSEEVRNHHKKLRKAKRARKNKRGY